MSIEQDVIPESAAGQEGQLIAFDLRALAQFRQDGPNVTILSDVGAVRQVLFTFAAGQQLKEHQTSSQISVLVVRGRITFKTASAGASAGAVEARSGTLVQLEANVRHAIEARTNAVVLVTMTPSPAQHSLQHEVFDRLTPLVTRTQG